MQKVAKGKTGWVFSELYMWHDTQRFNLTIPAGLTVQPGEHAENEETKRRFRNLVEVSALHDHLIPIKPRLATDEELLRFHTQEHLTFLEELCKAGGGIAGNKTPAGQASYEIAKLAVGGVLESVDAVLTGQVNNAYVLCRPPGHHANANDTYGFCLLANGVLGVEHARQVHGVERIAVVDWDVHHGNSAETAFYDDPNILTISIHQDNLFPPERGKTTDLGNGKGLGANLNIPMPAGSGSAAYRSAFDKVIVPALQKFQPDMIFVASGFDASAMDPLGHMMLSSDDYRYMARSLLDVADSHCNGHLIMTHEGGYSAAYVPYCGLAVLETMSGLDAKIEDPFLTYIQGYGGQLIQEHQQAVIDEVAKKLSTIKTK